MGTGLNSDSLRRVFVKEPALLNSSGAKELIGSSSQPNSVTVIMLMRWKVKKATFLIPSLMEFACSDVRAVLNLLSNQGCRVRL